MTSDDNKELYVWVYLPDAVTPVIAGRLRVENVTVGRVGTFLYGKSYISHPKAFSLDPVKLPLNSSRHKFTALNGFPSVLLDSCPDNWGIRVIHQLNGPQSIPDGYLLMNDPGRVGALAFTQDLVQPAELKSREFPLEELLRAAEAVEKDLPVDDELLRALNPGTGGARPKCNIIHDGQVWIAKFPSTKDLAIVSQPRIEHAVMTLADLCGVETAETKLIEVSGKDVCLIKRFDREVTADGVQRKHYMSARTVFYADDAFSQVGFGSYQRLARWLQRYVNDVASAKRQLYRRMVFNVAVRNSDDHELNHGLIHVRDNAYVLSPAFDISPVPSNSLINQHALLIGASSSGTVASLLEAAEAFEIDRTTAKHIIQEVQSTIEANWLDNLYSWGFDDAQIAAVSGLFKPIPIDNAAKA